LKKNCPTDREHYTRVYSFDAFNYQSHKLKVTGKDSLLINGAWRKRFTLIGPNNPCSGGMPNYFVEKWVEGIGCLNGPFNSGISDICIFDYCLPLLLCHKKNGTLEYIDSQINSCYATPCTGSGLRTYAIDANISVYPNPAINEITVNLNGNTEESELKVYTLLGQLLIEKKSQYFSSNKLSMDISTLKAGIYLLKCFSQDKLIGTMKFVKLDNE
jgi:hypothetical protein